MEKMDFYVYLSPKEAAEKVKEAVTAGLYSGEILDEYVRILPNGKEIIMVYSRNTICAPATEPR
mgnify:CR=1 FL=1